MMVLLCTALSGAMFYLSQGIDNVWWLAWVAPVPLLWLAYGEARGWQLFAAGLVAYAAGQIYFFQAYGTLLLPTELGFMLGNGALFGAAMLFARHSHRSLPPAAALLAFPALWTTLEYLEGWLSPHGSWGALGYSQVSFPAAIQIAALFGLYAVTFLLCLFANALALAARGARETGAAGVMLCALCVVYGVAQLAAPQTSGVRVAALADEGRAYIKAFHTGDEAAALAVTREYAAAIRAEAAKGTHFFVTPEGGVLAQSQSRKTVLTPLAAAARDTHSTIVVGAQSRAPARNMALAFLPDGSTITYDKRHLLLPLESRFTPGHAPGLLGRARAMAICKDMDFPRTCAPMRWRRTARRASGSSPCRRRTS